MPAGADQKLPLGQIIRTSGHQLRCTDVLHGACGKWDGGAGACEQVSVNIPAHNVGDDKDTMTSTLCGKNCTALFLQ